MAREATTVESLTKAQRDAIQDSDFAWPDEQKFPINNQAHLDAACKLLGHAPADKQAMIKRNILKIAARKGLTLPDSWKSDAKEGAVMVQRKGKRGWQVERSASPAPKNTTAVSMPFKPKERIARIKSYFLENNAISLNGRQYPESAVDQLIASAQRQLSDPNALPLTCYLSHDHADRDSTLDIAGKIVDVQREGSKAFALIDIPDTTTGREVATLVAGGYIRSQSLRASGAEMYVSREHSFPQVGGKDLTLLGIDYTSTPGLPSVARIDNIVLESDQTETTLPAQSVTEYFNAHPTTMHLEVEQEEPMTDIKEEGLTSVLSGGDTIGTDGSEVRGDYAKRMYFVAKPADGTVAPENAPEAMDAHDRIAYVVGMSCAPSTMEAIARFGDDIVKERAALQEAGAKLSNHNKMHLNKAHDGIAKHLGLECSSTASNDGMQDNDNDDKQESVAATVKRLVREALKDVAPAQIVEQKPVEQPVVAKETKKMTPEEAAKLLAEAGYKIEAPKSADQLAQEALEARLAEQQKAIDAKLEEMKKLMAQSAAPAQRTSLVEGATAPASPVNQAAMRKLSWVKEQVRATDPSLLADRSAPLPEWMQQGAGLEQALKEYSLVLLGMADHAHPFA